MTRLNRATAVSFPLLGLALAFAAAPPAGAAEAAWRDFVPAQAGFQPQVAPVAAFAPGRVLVKLTPAALQAAAFAAPAEKGGTVAGARTGLASLDGLLAKAGATRLERALVNTADKAAGTERWYLADVADDTDLPALASQLARDPNLEAVELDWYAFPAVVPNDPNQAANWGHNNTAQLPAYGWGTTWNHTGAGVGTVGFDTNAQVAWGGTQGYGNASTIVAIIDTGVDTAHPDLQLVPGFDFGSNDSNPHDDSGGAGHGTCCAGVAAAVANNSLGTAGIAGACRIMPLKIADAAGSLTLAAAANALYFAADNGADIASMSFGAAISSNAIMDAAITYANNAGVVMFAATGNENKSTISYPAINASVIAVGAASPCGDRKRSSSSTTEVNPGVTVDPNGYTCDGERWWGSSYGRTTQDHAGAVDLLAPTILPTTDISGSAGYQAGDYEPFFNGTSCSTPYAAGVAALVRAQNPTWTPAQVRARLTSTAIDITSVESAAGWDRYTGYGMVDAQAAVGASADLPPVAAFTSGATSGCAPFNVSFSDASTGSITGWAWSFGDGGTSTLQNPSHAYLSAGAYTVSLTVTGPGGSDSETLVGLVSVGEPAVPNFLVDVAVGTAPLTVHFTDQSIGAVDTRIWDFGDGATGSDVNPAHVYGLPGTYSVSLTTFNACGSLTTVQTNLVTVNAPAPIAAFTTGATTGCAPLTVEFSDISTGSITGWAWDFGDGGTSALQNPSHTYTAAGTYTVSLTVTGPGGDDAFSAADLVAVGGAPTAAFSASDTTGTAPLAVTFSDLSTGAESWNWDFGGDGLDTVQHPAHTFTAPGLYPVTLVVTNACGADTTQLVLEVLAPDAPVAAFVREPVRGCAPLTVNFTDQSTGLLAGRNWYFGDATADTAAAPAHLYAVPGSYDVRLVVFGPGGADTLTVPGAVVVDGPVAAAFSVDKTSGPGPLTITFTDESTGGAVSWLWNFGDGQTDTAQDPVHVFANEGSYDVTLTVTGSCGDDSEVKAALVVVSGLSGVGDVTGARFGLAQNYPNPFNPLTTIAFSLGAPAHARLEIFDATGRLVDVLVDESRSAGPHTVRWQPAEHASGVYFARFTAEGKVATTRMVLLK